MNIAIAAIVGALTWSFLEYVIHRWLGHDRRFRGNPFGVEHIRHHAEGGYFAPNWKKGLVTLALIAVLTPPAWLLGGTVGAAYVVGLIGFYLVYEILHRLEHVHAGWSPYGRWARRHHFTHHFVDVKRNHGVTSPVWDVVFGTYRKPGNAAGIIPVPRKLAMQWLPDPTTGTVRSRWADVYQIV